MWDPLQPRRKLTAAGCPGEGTLDTCASVASSLPANDSLLLVSATHAAADAAKLMASTTNQPKPPQ